MLSVRARRSERLLRSSRACRPRVISHLPMSEMDSYSVKLCGHTWSRQLFDRSLCHRCGLNSNSTFCKQM